jgi:predicted DNA-binding transcriptional regulator AlpA
MADIAVLGASASFAAARPAKFHNFFYGFDDLSRKFLFRIGGQERLGSGRLQTVHPLPNRKVALIEFKRTAGAETALSPILESFDCVDPRTGQRYRFSGVTTGRQVVIKKSKRVVRTASAPSENVTASSYAEHPSRPTSQLAQERVAVTAVADTRPACVAQNSVTLEGYAAALERIRLMRAAGIDPDLRMEFICQFLGESKANLYRKMKLDPPQFPKQTHRGRASFWPLSVIEAYKAGAWSPTWTAPVPGPLSL